MWTEVASKVRDWLGLPTHGQEHVDIERRLNEQRTAIARLDAYVEARRVSERRHVLTPVHPSRRADDA